MFPIPGHLVTLFGGYVPTPIQGTQVCTCPRMELGCPLAAVDPRGSLRSGGSLSHRVSQAVGTGRWVPALSAAEVMCSQEGVWRVKRQRWGKENAEAGQGE